MYRISQTVAKNVTPIPQLFLTNHSQNLIIKHASEASYDSFINATIIYLFLRLFLKRTTTPQNYADLMGLEKRIRLKLTRKGE